MPSDRPTPQIRTASTASDRQACGDIFFESMNGLHVERHLPPEDPADDDWLRAALDHFGATDPDSTVLADLGDDPVGFGVAYRRESFWFLAFLFVRPGSQAQGIGRAIIDHLLPPADERAGLTLATTIQAIQPISTALYASFGMAPRLPRYRLSGLRRPAGLPSLPEGIRSVPLDAGNAGTRDDLDRRVLGYARPQDHAHWLSTGTQGFGYVNPDGGLLAYGYLDDTYLSPVASEDQLLTAAVVADLLGRMDAPEKGQASIQGSAGDLLAAMLGAGMRIDDETYFPDIYCSTDPEKPHPAYIAYSSFLV
jgi:GNAT superfamily N-acetyltransferase